MKYYIGLPIYLYLVKTKRLTFHYSVKLQFVSLVIEQITKRNEDPFPQRKRVSVLNIDIEGLD